MARQLVHRFSFMFLCLLLLGASGIFVYQISPLRDPSFQPNGANAGTLVPWLRKLSEGNWVFVAAVLAAIIATVLTIILNQSYPRSRTRAIVDGQGGLRRWLKRFDTLLIGTWIVFFSVFWVTFVGYLLNQWIID